MKEGWKPQLETPNFSIYQKDDKSVIVTDEKIIFQTLNRRREKNKNLTTPTKKDNPHNRPSK